MKKSFITSGPECECSKRIFISRSIAINIKLASLPYMFMVIDCHYKKRCDRFIRNAFSIPASEFV